MSSDGLSPWGKEIHQRYGLTRFTLTSKTLAGDLLKLELAWRKLRRQVIKDGAALIVMAICLMVIMLGLMQLYGLID